METLSKSHIRPFLALVCSIAASGFAGCAESDSNLAGGVGGAATQGGQTATGQGGATAAGGAQQSATGGAQQSATGGAQQSATGGAQQSATGGAQQSATGGAQQSATGGATTGGAQQSATGGAQQSATGGTAPNTTTGGATSAGGSASAGGASSSSAGASSFSPLCGSNSAGTAIASGVACTASDPQLCYKTCGPENKGYKSETCTSSAYAEQSGCSFPPGDYACYKIPTALSSSCPTTAPQHGVACTVATCTPCNLGGGATGTYLDSKGASKVGWCICTSAGKWSCASTNAWPCPSGTGC